MNVVKFQYTISLVLVTFSLYSKAYPVKNKKDAIVKGIPYSIISLLLGWWGIPWGPIKTVKSIIVNLFGGKVIGVLKPRTEANNSMNEGAIFKG